MLIAVCFAASPVRANGPAYIAIIIDDIGNSLSRGEEAIAIPAPLTYAILPNSTHASSLAIMTSSAGKEVMVHLPMENTSHYPMGTGVLTRQQPRHEFVATFQRAIASVPHALGINNHMGSALTQEYEAMDWLMREIKDRRMYFVDSRTTPKTVAFSMAQSNGLSSASRDVFLDNEQSVDAIDASFARLIGIARERGTAIAIGHPYRVTLEYLRQALPSLTDVEVLPVSRVIALQRQYLPPDALAAE